MEVGLSSADLFKEIIWLGFASEFDLIGRAKTRKIGRYVLTIVLNKTESNGWFCKKQEISSSNSFPLPIQNSFVEIRLFHFQIAERILLSERWFQFCWWDLLELYASLFSCFFAELVWY